MKKLILLLSFTTSYFCIYAEDKVNDLVIIINPTTSGSPGNEASDELGFIFYDLNGKVVTVSYTYDPKTNTISITSQGSFIVVITNKKTGISRTVRMGVISTS